MKWISDSLPPLRPTPREEGKALWDKTWSFGDIESITFLGARGWVGEWCELRNQRSGAREQSDQGRASKYMIGASEWENGWGTCPVFTSLFLADFNHCASGGKEWRGRRRKTQTRRRFVRRKTLFSYIPFIIIVILLPSSSLPSALSLLFFIFPYFFQPSSIALVLLYSCTLVL